MKFFIYSRQEIEAMDPHDVSHVIVSIKTPDDPNNVKLPTNEHTKDVLHLQFHDIDRVVVGYSDHLEQNMFQLAHAKQVREFFERNKDVERFIVHCDAGLSRSPAVAAALSKLYVDDDDSYFFKRYHPNMRVYRFIIDEVLWHEASKIEPSRSSAEQERPSPKR